LGAKEVLRRGQRSEVGKRKMSDARCQEEREVRKKKRSDVRHQEERGLTSSV
jgi:hypothetical protein